MINADRLLLELDAAGLRVAGAAEVSARHSTAGPASYVPRDGGWVRLDWAVPPTAPQDQQAAAVVAAHDGNPDADERVEALALPRLLTAALAVESSNRRAGKPVPAWATTLIDAAAAKIEAARAE